MIDIRKRADYLRTRIAEMKAFLKTAPAGNLVCKSRLPGRYMYYRSINKEQKYIQQSRTDLARDLALKKLYKKTLISAVREASLLEQLSVWHGCYERDTETVLSNNPGLIPLLKHGVSDDSSFAAKISLWQAEDYKKNMYYPEYLIHDTIKGEKVRSKSEASIADMLFLAGMPYRYECELICGNETFYPDFMIMDPATGDIYIWEHFGLIDLGKYFQRTAHKISTYMANGYYPNVNLIITCETNKSPFTAVQASEMVSFFFHRDIQPRF